MSEAMEPGIGKQLAAARQAKGLTTADVADKLKLTARQIEALEAEEFERLPAAVFVRGFVRNYARLVGLSPENLLAGLGAVQPATETITAPSEGVTISSSPIKRWMIYLAAGGGLFLLLVALLYNWLSQGAQTLVVAEPSTVAPASQTTQSPAVPAQVPAQQPAPAGVPAPAGSEATPASSLGATAPVPAAPVVPPAMLPATPSAPVGQTVPLVPVRPPSTTPAPIMQPTPPVKPVEAPLAIPTQGTGVGLVRFSASEDSWVHVADGTGKRYSQLLTRNASASFRGAPPFKIVVGNAAAVRLLYNEQHIDLQPFTGDKVARLTLE
jgi:cytoskeleton protein RodZ